MKRLGCLSVRAGLGKGRGGMLDVLNGSLFGLEQEQKKEKED